MNNRWEVDRGYGNIYIYINIYIKLFINIMNTLQSCCAGPKHRMTIWKPLRHPVKQ